MTQTRALMLCLLLLNFFCLVASLEEFETINISEVKSKKFSISNSVKTTLGIVAHEVTSNYVKVYIDSEKDVPLYLSVFEEPASSFNSNHHRFQSWRTNFIYISKAFLDQSNSKFYLSVNSAGPLPERCSVESCSYSLNFESSEDITLEKGKQYSYVAEIGGKEVEIKIKKPKGQGGPFNIYAFGGNGIDKLEVSFGSKKYLSESSMMHSGKIMYIDDKDVEEEGEYVASLHVSSGFVLFGSLLLEPNKSTLGLDDFSQFGYYPNIPNDQGVCLNLPSEITAGTSYEINVLSKTRNLDLVFQSDNETEKYTVESQTQMILLGEDLSKYKTVCLKPNSKSKGVLTFQIQLTKFISGNMTTLDPLINGVSYVEQHEESTIRYYRHSKRAKEKTKETNFNIRTLGGLYTLSVYVLKCKNFPTDCAFDKEKLDALKEKGEATEVISGVHRIFNFELKGEEESHLLDPEQHLLVVYCQGNELQFCKYEVSFYDENDLVELIEYHSKSQLMDQPDKGDGFYFDVNEDNVETLVISFERFVGQSQFHISRGGIVIESFKRSYIGNKELIEIEKPTKGTYIITVKGNEGDFFSLYYYLVRKDSQEVPEIYVENGLIMTETLKANEKKRYLLNKAILKPENSDIYDVGFVTSIRPINCEVVVEYIGKRKTLGVTINPDDDGYVQHFLEYTEFPFYDASYEIQYYGEEECRFYIGGSIVKDDQEFVIKEGEQFKFTLGGEVSKMRYEYSHYINNGNAIITFDSVDKAQYSLKLNINSKFIEPEDTISGRDHFVVTAEQIKENCNTNLKTCSIEIDIEKVTAGVLKLEVVAKSSGKVPSYLRKHLQHNSIFFGGAVQYYYTELSKDEEGEVVLNFKHGSGSMFARIVSREDYPEAEADWIGKVKLPVRETADPLKYDAFNRKLFYTKAETSKCTKGCDLYIGVVSENEYAEDGNMRFLEEYSIFTRKRNVEEMTLVYDNELVVDSLYNGKDTNNLYNFYQVIVPYNSSSVTFEFESENLNMYINVFDRSKEHDAPKPPKEGQTEPRLDYEIISENGKFLTKTFTRELSDNQLIAFSVGKNQKVEGLAAYKFKVFFQPKEKSVHVVDIDTDEENVCEVKNGEYCYFVLPKKSFETFSKLYLYTYLQENSTALSNLYVSFSEDNRGEFPTKEKHDFSSEGQIHGEYLEIDLGSLKSKNLKIYIGVYSEWSSGNHVLLASSTTDIKSTLVNPTKGQLFSLLPSGTLDLVFPNENEEFDIEEYLLTLSSVSGKGKAEILKYSGENPNSYLKKFTGMKDFLTVTTHNNTLKIINTGEENFIFYYRCSVKDSAYAKLNFGSVNKFAMLQKTSFEKPIEIFSKIESREDILIEINFINYEVYEQLFYSEYDANITARTISEEQYKKKLNDKNYNLTNEVAYYANGTITSIRNKTEIILDREHLSSDKDYIYIQFKSNFHSDDGAPQINTFSPVSFEASVSPRTSHPSVPIGKFHFRQLAGSSDHQLYKLMKISKADTKMFIVFRGVNSHLTCRFLKSASDDYKKNSANVENTSDFLGRTEVTVSVKDEDFIYMSVFIDSNSLKESNESYNFTFKYTTEEEEKISASSLNVSYVKFDWESNQVAINLKTLHDTNLAVIPAMYSVLATEKTENSENFDSIAIINSVIETDNFIVFETEDVVTINFENPVDKRAYITVLATSLENGNFYVSHGYEFYHDARTLPTSLRVLVIVLIIVLILVIAGLVGYGIYRKNGDKITLKKKVDTTSFIAEPSENGASENIKSPLIPPPTSDTSSTN